MIQRNTKVTKTSGITLIKGGYTMNLLLLLLVCLGFMMSGYLIGLAQGGITVIKKQEQPEYQGLNDSVLDNLPPEYREFLDNSYGQVK